MDDLNSAWYNTQVLCHFLQVCQCKKKLWIKFQKMIQPSANLYNSVQFIIY